MCQYDASKGKRLKKGGVAMEQTKGVVKRGQGRLVCIFVLILLQALLVWAMPASAGFWTPTDSMDIRRWGHTATLLPNGRVLIAGGLGTSGYLSSAELYDPATGMFSPTDSMDTGRWEHTATLLNNGKVLIAGGSNASGYLSSAELYDPATGMFSAIGYTMTAARERHTATLLPKGMVLIAGGENASGSLSSAELYDPSTGKFTATGSMAAARAYHTATLLPNDKVLVAGGYGESASGFLSSAELYDLPTGTFSGTGSMTAARIDHTATLLRSGKVLIAGGYNGSDELSAELYDPATGTFSATGSMGYARTTHTATLLRSGKVLIAGGHSYLSSVELYDPATGSFSATGSMANARIVHTATLLANGKVLAAGGRGGSVLSSAELYDPATGNFTATGSVTAYRMFHTATLLPNGKVLVAGGNSADGFVSPAELYNPATGIFSATGSMINPRIDHTATLLPNGKVLIAGGGGATGVVLSSAELYNPATGIFSATGSMINPRINHTATLLPNGKVLIAGGDNGSDYLSSAELYDPATGIFSPTGSMINPRTDHTATLLPNGKVLIAGGIGADFLSSAELYDPATGTFSATGSMGYRRDMHTATLLPNGKVLVAGGYGPGGFSSAELYDPATGIFSPTGSMATARGRHTATLLRNGKVLVAGGSRSATSYFLSSAELYDPATETFSATGSMATARINYPATLLNNGKVLVAGAGFSLPLSAELYDPDLTELVIMSIETSPAFPLWGNSVTVTVTVKNQSTVAAREFNVDFYKNRIREPLAFEDGDFNCYIAEIEAGALQTCTGTVTYDGAGNNRMWAQVDADLVLSESNVFNNVYGPQTITVLATPPDLIVSALSAPAAAGPGDTITVTDTTKNSGTGASAVPTVTKLYLSTNYSHSADDRYLGERSVPSLAPGATSGGTTQATIPNGLPVGTYYLIAVADASNAVGESNETNNTKYLVVRVTKPDLVISALTGPSAVLSGQTINLSETTKNQGTAPAAASTTGFYLSTNASCATTDLYLTQRSVPSLAAGAVSGPATITGIVPSGTAPGTYYICAIADAKGVVPETIETNNTRYLTVRVTKPDLVISALTGPSAVLSGQNIELKETTKNQGAVTAAASTTRYYLSTDASCSTTDIYLTQRSVPSLSAGAVSGPATITGTVPSGTAPGTYYICAIADAKGVVPETIETNNTRYLTVRVTKPDLVISALTGPSTACPGQIIHLSETTKNQGAVTAGRSTTGYYLSTDASCSTTDIYLTQRSVPSLSAGAVSGPVTTTGTMPPCTPPRTYYICAIADALKVVPETVETNNTRYVAIGISACASVCDNVRNSFQCQFGELVPKPACPPAPPTTCTNPGLDHLTTTAYLPTGVPGERRLLVMHLTRDGTALQSTYQGNTKYERTHQRPIPAGTFKVLTVLVTYAQTVGTNGMTLLNQAQARINQDHASFATNHGYSAPLVEFIFTNVAIPGSEISDPRSLAGVRDALGNNPQTADLDVSDFDFVVSLNPDPSTTEGGRAYTGGAAPYFVYMGNFNAWQTILTAANFNSIAFAAYHHEIGHHWGWQHDWTPCGTFDPFMTAPILFGWIDTDGDGVPEILDSCPYGRECAP
jgi:subtilase family serine protease